MKRRDFIKTSAGFIVAAAAPGLWAGSIPVEKPKKYSFKPYTRTKSLAPVMQVTPDNGHYIQTYFDVVPWRPSQQYLAVTKLPDIKRMPKLGDIAEVCLIDLEKETIRTVYKTKSWGVQTGANVNWGTTDRYLYTNDVIDGTAVCVRVDLETGDIKAYSGPLYHIAPDESSVIGFPHELRDVTQLGYGVPPESYDDIKTLPPGAAKDEGIWRTDLKTNEKTLLVSLADVAAKVPEPPPRPNGTFYFWHSKFNPKGTRIYQVLRCLFPGYDGPNYRNPMVFTFNPDGSNIKFTSPGFKVWFAPGGHPNWHPDGEHIIRHFRMEDDIKRFFLFKYDGSETKQLSEKIEASGHPSIEPSGRFLITDDDSETDYGQSMKLRLIDFIADASEVVCELPTINWKKNYPHKLFELDGHPVWNRDFTQVSLQAAPDGYRGLFVFDMKKLMS
jgi:hypothetical protein